MDVRDSLLRAMDGLFSSETCTQYQALSTIERLMAQECISSKPCAEGFWRIQDLPECNVAVRLSLHLVYTMPILRQALQSYTGSSLEEAISGLCQILTILQGVALNHPSSKKYLQRRIYIGTVIELLSVARHISLHHDAEVQPNASGSASTSSMSAAQEKGNHTNRQPLRFPHFASSILDTLLCILVDSPPALRCFEECNGLESVVKTLKRAGTDRELRVKCLEFLYFYLLPENGHSQQLPQEVGPSIPTPSSPSKRCAPADIPLPPSPAKPSSHITFDRSFPSTPSTPSTRVTRLDTPSTNKSSVRLESTKQSHPNLAILRRDLDFVPLSPKKRQISALGIGTPKSAGLSRLRPSPEPSDAERSPTKSSFSQVRKSSPLARNETMFSSPKITNNLDDGIPHSATTPPPSSPTKSKGPPIRHTEASKGSLIRSTEEKKLLLSTWLGNVDALVEGVQRAGVWGLD
ncbi:cell division control protein 14, SIN component-domain-containing protein [Cantharellus anzutake]|uniref:cell division control protein 14, SIN component-domain-containing protein n=1 Tax=Cantharellus anzutake TaxID=1750568 RepID=UPI0019058A42|nr:cell division control protein 14, SIN component-domain-containing protein [Cantharellus anzutake]KAF8338843.1 cell division control protein 14, SIN component-domain-containing protein [Cantharellus anzutake]